MLIIRKKYKLLRNILKLTDLIDIIRQNSFLSFYYIQYTNAIKYSALKMLLSSLNLQLFYCDSILLIKKLIRPKTLIPYEITFFVNNILLIYKKGTCTKFLYDCNFLFDITYLLKELNVLPLFILYFNKFFYMCIYNQIFSLTLKRKSLLSLISILSNGYYFSFYYIDVSLKGLIYSL